MIMTCKGKVRGNTVIIENDALLPEGSLVEIRVLEYKPNLEKRRLAVESLLALGEKLKDRNISLSKYITEAREELENRV